MKIILEIPGGCQKLIEVLDFVYSRKLKVFVDPGVDLFKLFNACGINSSNSSIKTAFRCGALFIFDRYEGNGTPILKCRF